jgi:hypothetical protein
MIDRTRILGIIALICGVLSACGGDDTSGGAGGTDGGAPGGAGGSGATNPTGGQAGAGGTGAVGTGGGGVATGGGSGGGLVDAGPDASDAGGAPADAALDVAVDVALEAGEAGEAGDPCPGELENITGEGTVSATNTYSESSVDHAVDGDTTTSWWVPATFTSETFTWALEQDECIGRIQIANTTADVSSPGDGSWAGWGFGQIIVRVFNGAGTQVDERTLGPLAQPNPNLDINLAALGAIVQGRTVTLEVSGFAQAYGGFSELTVSAVRAPPPVDGGP